MPQPKTTNLIYATRDLHMVLCAVFPAAEPQAIAVRNYVFVTSRLLGMVKDQCPHNTGVKKPRYVLKAEMIRGKPPSIIIW